MIFITKGDIGTSLPLIPVARAFDPCSASPKELFAAEHGAVQVPGMKQARHGSLHDPELQCPVPQRPHRDATTFIVFLKLGSRVGWAAARRRLLELSSSGTVCSGPGRLLTVESWRQILVLA